MKVAAAILVGLLVVAAVAVIGTVVGGLLAHVLAERVGGQKEPMVAMLFGGVIGLLFGTGGGLILGVYIGVRTHQLLGKLTARR